MPSQATAKTDQAAGVIPAAAWRLRAVDVLPNWQLAVTFNDGTTGVVDLAELVNGSDPGVFAALRDVDFFAQVQLDCGAVRGPTGPISRPTPCTRKSAAPACGESPSK